MRSNFATKAPRRSSGRQKTNNAFGTEIDQAEEGAPRSSFALFRRRDPGLSAIPSLREERLSYRIRKLLAPMHPGRMAEWLNAPVLKTGEANNFRGFESHSFRQATLCRRQFQVIDAQAHTSGISSNSKKPFLYLQEGLFCIPGAVEAEVNEVRNPRRQPHEKSRQSLCDNRLSFDQQATEGSPSADLGDPGLVPPL